MSKIYIGDEGTVLYVNTGIDLTTATVLKIKVLKPNNTETDWVGTIDNTTRLKYEFLNTDLTLAGVYKIQSYIENPDGKWLGNTTSFTVTEKFN